MSIKLTIWNLKRKSLSKFDIFKNSSSSLLKGFCYLSLRSILLLLWCQMKSVKVCGNPMTSWSSVGFNLECWYWNGSYMDCFMVLRLGDRSESGRLIPWRDCAVTQLKHPRSNWYKNVGKCRRLVQPTQAAESIPSTEKPLQWTYCGVQKWTNPWHTMHANTHPLYRNKE